MTVVDWVVLPHPAAVGRYAAERAAEILNARTLAGRPLTMALAGGSTPRHMYRAMAGPLASDIPWSQLMFFMGDERAVPLDDTASNFRSAQETLLSKVPIRAGQVHRPRAEADDLEAAAREYEQIIKTVAGTPPQFDLVLLGMGPDGHTASLFPGEPEPDGWYAATRAPPETAAPRRLSLTYRALLTASDLIVMVTGAEKAARIAQVIKEDGALPMQRILHHRSKGTWVLMDEAAATHMARNVPEEDRQR